MTQPRERSIRRTSSPRSATVVRTTGATVSAARTARSTTLVDAEQREQPVGEGHPVDHPPRCSSGSSARNRSAYGASSSAWPGRRTGSRRGRRPHRHRRARRRAAANAGLLGGVRFAVCPAKARSQASGSWSRSRSTSASPSVSPPKPARRSQDPTPQVDVARLAFSCRAATATRSPAGGDRRRRATSRRSSSAVRARQVARHPRLEVGPLGIRAHSVAMSAALAR